MVNITITMQTDKFTAHFDGHAGFNPGNDIVCAAISALAYTLLGTLQNLKHDFPNDFLLEHFDNHGVVFCNVSNISAQAMPHVIDIFKTIYIGLKQIEAKYPAHLKIFLHDS